MTIVGKKVRSSSKVTVVSSHPITGSSSNTMCNIGIHRTDTHETVDDQWSFMKLEDNFNMPESSMELYVSQENHLRRGTLNSTQIGECNIKIDSFSNASTDTLHIDIEKPVSQTGSEGEKISRNSLTASLNDEITILTSLGNHSVDHSTISNQGHHHALYAHKSTLALCQESTPDLEMKNSPVLPISKSNEGRRHSFCVEAVIEVHP